MHIVAPIVRLNEAEAVINAGADEIYCGVFIKERSDKYSIGCLNKRPGASLNLVNYSDLKMLVKKAHLYNIAVNFTLNEFYYEREFLLANEQMEKALDCGVDALIISDIGLICKLREKRYDRVKLHISTAGTTFNSETIKFYKELGASRIILPRHLTLNEIRNLATKIKDISDIDLEIIILNERCYNIDGFCAFRHGVFTFYHRLFSEFLNNRCWNKNLVSALSKTVLKRRHNSTRGELACCLKYNINCIDDLCLKKKQDLKRTAVTFAFSDPKTFLNACGACSIYDLNEIGIKYIKIVGRRLFGDKVKDVRFITDSMTLLSDKLTKNEYIEKIKELFQKTFRYQCNRQYCYYDYENNY